MGGVNQFLCGLMFETRNLDRKRNLNAEALAIVTRANADRRRYPGFCRQLDLLLSCNIEQCGGEAGGIARGKKLLGIAPSPPGPPISFGGVSLTSKAPSSVRAVPSRPPVDVALVV